MSQPPGTQSVTTDFCGIPPGAVSGPTPFPDCHAQWRWICRWLLPQRSATPLPTFLTLFSEPTPPESRKGHRWRKRPSRRTGRIPFESADFNESNAVRPVPRGGEVMEW